jgi:16S rRNA (uracil1498-N3)-methyltransferase
MHIFYTPDISGNSYILNEEESKHCIRVLRLQIDDEINLIDGKGGFYKAKIVSENPKSCALEIVEKKEDYEKRNYNLHLAVAPTKNSDRIEWLIEKAVEIGFDEFTPIICEHSERKHINIDRLERIVISAMKQSVKAFKPVIHECISFRNFMQKQSTSLKFIAHCYNDKDYLKLPLNKIYKKSNSVICIIGPEGDFSEKEVIEALKVGYKGISLGSSRLRTETAALVACHSFYFMNM